MQTLSIKNAVSLVRSHTARRIGFGVVLWTLAYAIAIPLLRVHSIDIDAFRSLMFALASILASVLTVLYFQRIERDYLRESIVLAVTWIILNWVLDLVALVPFTGQSVPMYFAEMGVEYIGLIAPIVAIGYLLEKKSRV